jgi:hypothetical protein
MKSHIPGHEKVELLERQLFRSFSGDEPPAHSRRIAAAALGLGGAALTSATAGAEGASVASIAAKTGPMVLAKWIGIGTLAGAVSLGAVHYAKAPASAARANVAATLAATREVQTPATREPQAPPAPDSQAELSSEAPAQRAIETPAAALQHSSARRAEHVSRAASAPGARTRSPLEPTADDGATSSPPPDRSVAPSVLAAEIALLDEARSAVATKGGARALELLDHYAQRFPSGTLSLEATVLRIEALYLTGATSAAAALAHGFLAAHPASTHAARVRRLLAEHDKP